MVCNVPPFQPRYLPAHLHHNLEKTPEFEGIPLTLESAASRDKLRSVQTWQALTSLLNKETDQQNKVQITMCATAYIPKVENDCILLCQVPHLSTLSVT